MRLKELTIQEIISENERRKALADTDYNPITGAGCLGPRISAVSPVDGSRVMIPASLYEDPEYALTVSNAIAWQKLRFRHDFEFWAATAVRIKDKLTGRDVPLILNRAQRLVLDVLEKQRISGQPLRIIILKARQWGGSTLVQMYMAWIQSIHRENWHSLICAHVKDTASGIRGMYTRMLDNYPRQLWTNSPSASEDSDAPRFRPFERSLNTREIVGRGCRVTVGSAENQEAVRGADFAMAHLSEAAFWGDSTRRNPEDFIRAVCSGIMLEPLTLIAVESTANGVGNWFHREWLRAEKGLSDKVPVFVPWYYIDIYELPVTEDEIPALTESLGEYEENLWMSSELITLEKLKWYRNKSREYPLLSQMHAEFPSNAIEAFTSTGKGVFDINAIDRLRRGCRNTADMMRGEINGENFAADSTGRLLIVPEALCDLKQNRDMLYRYVVGVDVGGRSAGSDLTVIAVLDRYGIRQPGTPEFVAQWRGHCDYDILVRKAADIARFFGNALLVVESNTLEHADAVSGLGIIKLIAQSYSNVYRRQTHDEITNRPTHKIGFHTNRATKLMLIAGLQNDIREEGFIENFAEAADEFATYEEPTAGVFAARTGCHDDMLMARALALEVSRTMPAIRRSAALAPVNLPRF